MMLLKAAVLERFNQEILEKKLCYHNQAHIEAVQRRACQLFQVVRAELPHEMADRLAILLDFCAVAHDLVQVFLPVTDAHSPRRREAGVSETATIHEIRQFIQGINQQTSHLSAQITVEDMHLIQEAIEATICAYDPQEQAIYQPSLYEHDHPISLVARLLAIADIGSLAMEGLESYNQEGRLIFLEENPDVYDLLATGRLLHLATYEPDLAENVRQRLLRRSQFQVSFAKSRFKRSPQELEGLPAPAIPIILNELFSDLTPANIQQLESVTPTDPDTPLQSLIDFFQLTSLHTVFNSLNKKGSQ